MNDNQEQPQSSASTFSDELNRLGKNLNQLIKNALESPQLQDVRKEVTTGAQGVIAEINDAINKARESDVTKNFTQKATRTAQEIKTKPVKENVKSGLVNALKSINREITELVAHLEESQQPAPPQTPDEDSDE